MSVKSDMELSLAIKQRVNAIAPSLVAIRRDIHAHPELGFDTLCTAALVRDELERLGLSPRCGVGRSGVLVDIQGA